MGTRAVFTFKAHGETYHVYKHWDGYPREAARFIANAVRYAWGGDRFESSDFAAAFIAGNKQEGGGDVYFSRGPNKHGDLEYSYEIYPDKRTHVRSVKAYEVGYTSSDKLVRKQIFNGTLDKFISQYGDYAVVEEHGNFIKKKD